MPFVTSIPKKNLEAQMEVLNKLESECEKKKIFGGKEADDIFVYYIMGEFSTKEGPAMMACARYKRVYAIVTADYLTKEQIKAVYHSIMSDLLKEEEILVFSEEDYKIAKEIAEIKNVKVSKA